MPISSRSRATKNEITQYSATVAQYGQQTEEYQEHRHQVFPHRRVGRQ
jgi:hypothetical protein